MATRSVAEVNNHFICRPVDHATILTMITMRKTGEIFVSLENSRRNSLGFQARRTAGVTDCVAEQLAGGRGSLVDVKSAPSP